MPVVHEHDEVGSIVASLGAVAVGNLETQVVVLDVGADSGVRLRDPAELGFPLAVADHPVDVTAARVGLPADLLRRDKVHVDGRAGRVVGVKDGADRPLSGELRDDASSDPLASHVGELLVAELRRVGSALADQMVIEPLTGDAFQLAEQVELRLLAGVAPLGFEEPFRQVIDERGAPDVLEMIEAQVYAFADDAFVAGDCRSYDVWSENERRIVVERCGEALFGQLDAVALHAREVDLALIAVWCDRAHLHGLARRLRRGDHGFDREIEGDAEHIRILDVELTFLVQIVGLTPQRAAQ